MYDFSPDKTFYWGEISREEMVQVNQQAERSGWFNAVMEKIIQPGKKDLAAYLFDRVRIAGLFHYYEPDKNEAVLDLGSGWGPLSFGLARFYKNVYSVDGVSERLHFQAIRARQDGVENLRVIKSSMLKLPILDGSMDAVIVNGLLEWIGLSDEHTPPRELQVNFLKEVFRVLKPGGKIFVGIENRTGAQFFLGSHDHTGLKFTSLLPRWLAGWVVRAVKRDKGFLVFSGAEQSYRTLTYTWWGYRKLLSEAGFQVPEFLWTWPSYNYPNVSGSVDGRVIKYYLSTIENQQEGLRGMLIRAVSKIPEPGLKWLLKIFSPHFLILAEKSATTKTAPTLGINGHVNGGFLRVTRGSGENLETSVLWMRKDGTKKIERIHAVEQGERSVLLSTQAGVTRGRPIRPDNLNEVHAAGRWLADHQRSGNQGTWERDLLAAELDRLLELARTHTTDPEQILLIGLYADRYRACLADYRLPVVVEHGDLTPTNVLVAPPDHIEVINWDHRQRRGHPWMDIGSLNLALLTRDCGPKAPCGGWQAGPGVQKFLRPVMNGSPQGLSLAPAYYILRVVAREVGPGPLNDRNYLSYRKWMPLLSPALEYALKGDTIT